MVRYRILLSMLAFIVLHLGCRSELQTRTPNPPKIVNTPTIPQVTPSLQTKVLPLQPTVKVSPIKKTLPQQPVAPSSTRVVKSVGLNTSLVKLPGTKKSRFLSATNFVTHWLVYGPYTFKDKLKAQSSTAAIIHYPFIDDEKKIATISDDAQLLLPGDKCIKQFPGRVNLAKIYPGIEYAAAYAIAYLECQQPMQNLKLYSGSGGYIKIWLNGKLIHTYNRHNRNSHWDQDIVNGITLKQGLNQVVVKTVTIAKPWSFYFRLADKNGFPLTFTPSHK